MLEAEESPNSLIHDCAVRYYGVVATETVASYPPKVDDVLRTMSRRKKTFKNVHCLVSCTNEGVVVSHYKSHHVVVMWAAARVKLCATITHPGPHSKGQCITLLQVADSENFLRWHIFMYADVMRDKLVESLQTVMRRPTPIVGDLGCTPKALEIIAWGNEVMCALKSEGTAFKESYLADQNARADCHSTLEKLKPDMDLISQDPEPGTSRSRKQPDATNEKPRRFVAMSAF
eukprot:m.468470 g.468470  ORF g.468470 m.468470 type:complete len:232 (+) comp27521_c0_seq1:145-840(+)